MNEIDPATIPPEIYVGIGRNHYVKDDGSVDEYELAADTAASVRQSCAAEIARLKERVRELEQNKQPATGRKDEAVLAFERLLGIGE